MQDPDQVLVERLRNKDKRAFELVFNEYYGLLKSYAMRFMDDPDDAEEVIQEVFVKFWEKCDTLAPDSSIKSYLYRSVHNTCLNFIKHQKVKDSYRQYVITFMEEAVEGPSPDGEKSNVQERIFEAIDNLPPRCSEIFKLSRFEGLKYQEIADHLSISIKTVEVQMGKALKTLREKLKDLN
ncbi:MAG: RNA polymerase sigma-70 factor [Marinoscillum sp.]|uniref:RNA polymerase sigma-70 factor n=1 Tax=Marinoscillum sp. TaxID=2024838 RepID=UPI0032F76282